MGYVYSDPEREADEHALPNVEVFYVHEGKRKAYDRVYRMDYCEHGVEGHRIRPCYDCPPAGWYWQAGFPGCLPDGDPFGPFDSFDAALADAREN